ncbi:MAG: porin [Halioglobus sp.]|nr:porin [Halioglobus sp.]
MKRKLIPAMIGAALVGGMTAAQADITVFGHIDSAVSSHDADLGFVDNSRMLSTWATAANVAGVTDNNDDLNLTCTSCSIGFKGSESLGNGLTGLFYLDFEYDTNNDGEALTDRNQYLGLSGNFGRVIYGTVSTSWKSHGAMLDPLYRTAVQGRTSGLQSFLHRNNGEDGEGRADNSFRWDSPNWNGVKVTAHYTLDSNEKDGVGGVDEDDDAYGIGAQYSNGGILAFADYIANNSDSVTNPHGDLSGWKVGGKYTINNFSLMGQYEDIEDGLGATANEEFNNWHLGGSYDVGNNTFYAAYGQGELTDILTGTNDDHETTAYTLAAIHKLSKRTSVYAAYNQQEQENGSALNGALDGLAGAAAGTVNDPEKTNIAIGLKHKF